MVKIVLKMFVIRLVFKIMANIIYYLYYRKSKLP